MALKNNNAVVQTEASHSGHQCAQLLIEYEYEYELWHLEQTGQLLEIFSEVEKLLGTHCILLITQMSAYCIPFAALLSLTVFFLTA